VSPSCEEAEKGIILRQVINERKTAGERQFKARGRLLREMSIETSEADAFIMVVHSDQKRLSYKEETTHSCKM